MFIFAFCIVTVLGLYIGSLVVAISLRIVAGERIFVTRSVCDNCKTTLKLWQTIPIFGMLRTRGKCPSCGTKVSLKYSIWEVIHAICYMLNFIFLKENIPAFVFFCLITSTLISMSVIDFETMFVYDVHIIIFGLLLICFLYYTSNLNITLKSFIMASMPPLFKFGYESIRKKLTGEDLTVLGWGDVKIFMILFFFLDFSKLTLIILTSGLLGSFFGVIRKKRCFESHFPFIPLISLSFYFLSI